MQPLVLSSNMAVVNCSMIPVGFFRSAAALSSSASASSNNAIPLLIATLPTYPSLPSSATSLLACKLMLKALWRSVMLFL